MRGMRSQSEMQKLLPPIRTVYFEETLPLRISIAGNFPGIENRA